MNYLKQPFWSPYVPWRLLGMLFLIDLVVLTYYVIRPFLFANTEYPHPVFYVAVLGSILGPLLTGILCLKGSFRHLDRSALLAGTRQTRRFSPLLWGLNVFIYGAGQLAWLIQILFTQKVPLYPAPTHYIQLLIYPFLIVAILLLPAHSLSRFVRLSILLDGLIIMAAVTTLCYYFVLEPVLVRGHGTLLAKVVGGIYPVLDLLLMFSILVVALRSGERILHPILLLMGLVAVLLFMSNVIHLYELLYNDYDEFSLARVAMLVAGTFDIGAAQTVNAIVHHDTTVEPSMVRIDDLVSSNMRWKIILPAVLVLVFGLLIFLIWLDGGQIFPGQMLIVYIGGLVVLILMVVRQFLAMYQIGFLQNKLQRENRSLDHLNAQLEKQAMTDSLTDVPNRQALASRLAEVVAEARTTAGRCAVIFIDIDHFKGINDFYGHLMGDMVLGYFARTVAATVRRGDLVGRWGGEEFVVVLPETGTEEAWQVAERIRVAVSQRMPGGMEEPGLTCSLGLACYPEDAEEQEGLLRQADEAMYTAKHLGRNQVYRVRRSRVLIDEEIAAEIEQEENRELPEMVEALIKLMEKRDPALGRHVQRVATLSCKLAHALGLQQEEVQAVRLGGLLHALGEITMPDERRSGHEQAREDEQERRYPAIGATILGPLPALRASALIVRTQQEWVDGSGAPYALKGEEIPLGARIVAVADAYETLLSEEDRCRERASAEVMHALQQETGSRFDPLVVEALVRVHAPCLVAVDI